MQRFFTHCWKFAVARRNKRKDPLNHAAGSKFTQRGVQRGDRVYVVTLEKGALILLGKMQVGTIVFSDDEVRRRLGFDPYHAQEHLIASARTPIQWIRIPIRVVKQLAFVSAAGRTRLKFESPGVLDRQTLRGCRELEAGSAAKLDRFLPAVSPL